MACEYDVELAGVGFVAVEPRNVRSIRRGGVVIWAQRSTEGWRVLSVEAVPIIGLLTGSGPPDADCLLISPPITDRRRLRGVRRVVEQAVYGLRIAGRRCAPQASTPAGASNAFSPDDGRLDPETSDRSGLS